MIGKIKKIKFSHHYEKFRKNPLPFMATLLSATITDDICPQFEMYDCSFCDDGKTADMYKLPKGRKILLLLWDGEELYTTIRRYTPRKWEYYKGLEGQDVMLVKI